MLSLVRKLNEVILIQCGELGYVRIVVTGIQHMYDGKPLANPRVEISIDAPREWPILREELVGRDYASRSQLP